MSNFAAIIILIFFCETLNVRFFYRRIMRKYWKMKSPYYIEQAVHASSVHRPNKILWSYLPMNLVNLILIEYPFDNSGRLSVFLVETFAYYRPYEINSH